MELTAQRRLLTALTAGCLAVAVMGVVWSLGSIDQPDQRSAAVVNAQGADPERGVKSPDTQPPEEPPAADRTSQADLSLKLQQPLYDPPQPPPPRPQPKPNPKPAVVRTPPPAKAARLDWTLTGTIIDADQSVAILTDASGKTDIRAAGEVVELSPPGVLVRKIDSEKVTLDVRGTESTLRLQQSFQSGGDANPDRPNRRRDR